MWLLALLACGDSPESTFPAQATPAEAPPSSVEATPGPAGEPPAAGTAEQPAPPPGGDAPLAEPPPGQNAPAEDAPLAEPPPGQNAPAEDEPLAEPPPGQNAPLAEDDPPPVEGAARLPPEATPEKPPTEGAGESITAAGEGGDLIDPEENPPGEPAADPAAMDPVTHPPRYDPNTEERPSSLPPEGADPSAGPDSVDPGEGPSPDPERPFTEPDLSPYGDLYRVVDVPEISGATVSMMVSYGGGCGEHSWSARQVDDADGVEVVQVVHDSGGDGCRAIKRERISLDLLASGVDLCGREVVALEVAVGERGASPARYILSVDPALSRCDEEE